MPKTTKTQEVAIVHGTTGGRKLPGGQSKALVEGRLRWTTSGKTYAESRKGEKGGEE